MYSHICIYMHVHQQVEDLRVPAPTGSHADHMGQPGGAGGVRWSVEDSSRASDLPEPSSAAKPLPPGGEGE